MTHAVAVMVTVVITMMNADHEDGDSGDGDGDDGGDDDNEHTSPNAPLPMTLIVSKFSDDILALRNRRNLVGHTQCIHIYIYKEKILSFFFVEVPSRFPPLSFRRMTTVQFRFQLIFSIMTIGNG